MRFYWVQDQIRQGHYNVFWKPGATNFSDYLTKHHPPHHHRRMHPVHLYCPDISNNASARVCFSIQNTSLKEIPKKDSQKEAHVQIRKMETHRHTDGQTYRLTDGGK